MKNILISLVLISSICSHAIGGLGQVSISTDTSKDKIHRLENKLKEVNSKFVKIKNNEKKYKQLMVEYRKLSSKYKKLIDLCKKDIFSKERKELEKNFMKLKQSINTLNDMMETDKANFSSLSKQRKAIESLIKLEKDFPNL